MLHPEAFTRPTTPHGQDSRSVVSPLCPNPKLCHGVCGAKAEPQPAGFNWARGGERVPAAQSRPFSHQMCLQLGYESPKNFLWRALPEAHDGALETSWGLLLRKIFGSHFRCVLNIDFAIRRRQISQRPLVWGRRPPGSTRAQNVVVPASKPHQFPSK